MQNLLEWLCFSAKWASNAFGSQKWVPKTYYDILYVKILIFQNLVGAPNESLTHISSNTNVGSNQIW